MTLCPVCESFSTEVLHITTDLPVSIMQATYDPEQSLKVTRRCMHLYYCKVCKHVFNSEYDPRVADYSGQGCRMFNHGILWKQRVRDLQQYIRNQEYDTIVEIGPGDGSFLADCNASRKIVYEPSDDADKCEEHGYETIRSYYDGSEVILDGKTLYLMRHVMEHLEWPGEFLEAVTLASGDQPIEMLVEVPCIVNALQHYRLEDWTYEHAQHFTPCSLKRLFVRLGWTIVRCETQYENEVIVLHAKYVKPSFDKTLDRIIQNFQVDQERSLCQAQDYLKKLKMIGKRVVYWGGLGKSALFLHQMCPNDRDLIVVDSDAAKVGLCVPGMEYKLQYAGALVDNPPDVIVITTSWRKNDILAEIQQRGIKCDQILIYRDGQLTEANYGQ